jgi:hypothetical protein
VIDDGLWRSGLDLVSFPGGEGVDGCVKLPWRLFFRALW